MTSQELTQKPSLNWKKHAVAVQSELASRAETKLSTFVQAAWHVIEPGRPFIGGWALDAVCEHLQAVSRGEIKNLIVNIPPRHSKTTICSVCFPVWKWIHAPAKRFLTAGYGLDIAMRDSQKARFLIQSQWFKDRWGDRFHILSDANAKIRYLNDKMGYRQCTSPTGGIGTGEGGDFIIVDDPLKAQESSSEAARDLVLEWWDSAMMNRANDYMNIGRIIIMQRLHENDLTGHLMRKKTHWECLMLPAEFEKNRRCVTSIGWRDPRKEEGDLLWPARMGPPEIAEQKDSQRDAYAGQYQQRPTPAEGSLFKVQYFEGMTVEYKNLPKMIRVCRAWDMAATEQKGYADPDWTVGLKMGQDEKGRFYIIDVKRDRCSPGDVADLVKVCAQLDGKLCEIRIEQEPGSAGVTFIDTYHKMLQGYAMRGIRSTGEKATRATPIAIECQRKNVYIVKGEWNHVFMDELTFFPKGSHDDQVDAASSAFDNLSLMPLTVQWTPKFGKGLNQ